ncbi:MAG: hypothetical protein QXM75_04735, partial [Candidatus Diapherotrites archaeon]
EWLEEQGLKQVISGQTIIKLLGLIIHWFVLLLFLAQGAELMRYELLRNTLHSVIYFICLLLIALIILLSGVIVGRYIRNIIENNLEGIGTLMGLIAEAFIIFVAIIMALEIIPGINTTILHYAFVIAFGSTSIAIALALGISFGLALKDEASTIIRDLIGKNKKSRKKSR